MRRDINAAFDRFRYDEDAWVGIVTGTDPAFCGGADLRSETGDPVGDFSGSFWERPTVNSLESGWEIFKPLIAAVNGPCIGYGLTLLTCATSWWPPNAPAFAYPEVTVGIPTIVGACAYPPGSGGSTRWNCC